MPYQPDPKQVRAIADRIIRSEIDAIRDLGAMDIGDLAEDELTVLYDQSWEEPDSYEAAADALIAAVSKDISAAAIVATWPDGGA